MKKDNILSNVMPDTIFIEQIGFQETFTVQKKSEPNSLYKQIFTFTQLCLLFVASSSRT